LISLRTLAQVRVGVSAAATRNPIGHESQDNRNPEEAARRAEFCSILGFVDSAAAEVVHSAHKPGLQPPRKAELVARKELKIARDELSINVCINLCAQKAPHNR
jgi:hypothetical protein